MHYSKFLLVLLFCLPAVVEPGTIPDRSPDLAELLRQQAPDLNPGVLRLALRARGCAVTEGVGERPNVLTIIDYSRPSTEPRLWVLDLAERRVLFEELVSHGKNSGGNTTTSVSNRPQSLQSSLGLFVTANTYYGRNGYSMRLHGVEEGFNDNAFRRAIVMHGAPYVSLSFAKARGRLGRSWGCPAVRSAVARTLIDTIKDGSLIFAFYPEDRWLTKSEFLDADGDCGNQSCADLL